MPSAPVAVVATVTVLSPILPSPMSKVAELVKVFVGPPSTEYVPLFAFARVRVRLIVSVEKEEPEVLFAFTVGTSGSGSGFTGV